MWLSFRLCRYQQKVHHNLLNIVQHIEDAPAVAMTTSQPPAPQQQQQEQQEDHINGINHQGHAVLATAVVETFQAPANSNPQQQQQQQMPAWLSDINQPVHQLLQQLGLLQFEHLLEQQHVDLAALQLMEERHMRELGLPIGAVVKIRAALAVQKQHHQQQQ